MKVTLHPGAENDIEEAAAFYERAGSAVLAARFITELKKPSGLLIEHPGIGSPRPGGRRGIFFSSWQGMRRILARRRLRE